MVLIKLIIKAPNQRLEDQTIDCDLDWNVLKLKTHLSEEYPTKPRIGDQRLIYSGHLLKNEQSLRDVLEPIEDDLTFTIHLVCSQPSFDTKNTNFNTNRMSSNSVSDRNPNESNSNSTANNDSSDQTSDNSTNNTNSSGIGSNPLPNTMPPFYGMGFNNAGPVNVTPEQMLQHMAYLQQQYAQYMAQLYGQNNLLYNQLGAQSIPSAVPPMVAPQAAPVPQMNPPQPQAAQPQVQRLNAGPGGAPVVDDDEDPNNRDWLDWFYWMSRAVVLFSIIYFYSSFNRFIFVVVLAVMLYLYQTNWNNRRRLQINNNNNLNAAPLVNNNVVANNTNADNNVREQEVNDAIDGDETEVMERPRTHVNDSEAISDPRITGLRFFWVIVSSLFTSLIPENPINPANLN